MFTKTNWVGREAGEDRLEILTNKTCIRAIFQPPVTGRSCSSDPVLCSQLLLYSCMQSRGWKQKLCSVCRYTSVRLQDHRVTGTDSLDFFFFFFFLPAVETSERNTFITDRGASWSCDWHLPHCRWSVSTHHLDNVCTQVWRERERKKRFFWGVVGLHMLIRLLYFIFCFSNFPL